MTVFENCQEQFPAEITKYELDLSLVMVALVIKTTLYYHNIEKLIWLRMDSIQLLPAKSRDKWRRVLNFKRSLLYKNLKLSKCSSVSGQFVATRKMFIKENGVQNLVNGRETRKLPVTYHSDETTDITQRTCTTWIIVERSASNARS